MEFASPNENHEWLQSFIGEWTYEHEAPDGSTVTGTETIEPVGEFWIKITQTGDAPSFGPVENIILLGHDVGNGKYVGTFISSMMSNLWVYEGTLDAARTTLTLESTGPNMMPGHEGELATYRDSVQKISDTEFLFRSEAKNDANEWIEFMRMPHRRK